MQFIIVVVERSVILISETVSDFNRPMDPQEKEEGKEKQETGNYVAAKMIGVFRFV